MAAAGNLQHDEFVRLVERHFPRERRESVQPPLPEPPPALPGEQRVPRDSAQVHICLGAQTFPHRDPRRYASILIATALGGGMSSRLFQRVREKLGLVYAIFTYQSFYAQAGLSGIYMATGPDGAERALAEVRSELESLAASGLPADELESVKNQTKGQLVLTLESTSARLQRLAGVALYNEPFLTPDDICARIDAVSETEVAELCREYYAAGRQVVVRLGPDGESRP